MGGPMSVNDPLPWIDAELDLIRNAQVAGMPILGHCLGAQLISKALGAVVKKSPVREIGWFKVSQCESCLAPYWLDNLPTEFDVYHMHGEMFSIPEGAALLLRSQFCDHQAFSIGNTLALQFHVEITEDLIRKWVDYYKDDLLKPSASVQSKNEILSCDPEWYMELNKVADIIYLNWLKGFN
jgi:GMP synthase-like glutamine amidotransferase